MDSSPVGRPGQSPGSEHPARSQSASKALAVYNLMRLGLLAGCLGLGYLAGLRSFALVIAALVVSGVISWFGLRTQRVKAALAVESAVARSGTTQKVVSPWRRRRDAMRARVEAEDAYADAARAKELRRQQAEHAESGQSGQSDEAEQADAPR